MLIIRRTSELKFPDEYETPHESSYQGHHVRSYDIDRLIDNKIWTKDEYKQQLKGRAQRRRDKEIQRRLKEAHRPWHQRVNNAI